MTLRERQDQPYQTPQTSDASGGIGDDAQELRDEGQMFLAAADDAINRVLSRNSNEFLAQNRQQGGQ